MRPCAPVVCGLIICIVPGTTQTGNACARLNEPIAAASIALTSGGARIDSVELISPFE